jgi:hypothetical protein
MVLRQNVLKQKRQKFTKTNYDVLEQTKLLFEMVLGHRYNYNYYSDYPSVYPRRITNKTPNLYTKPI